jgi:hypothetical protein
MHGLADTRVALEAAPIASNASKASGAGVGGHPVGKQAATEVGIIRDCGSVSGHAENDESDQKVRIHPDDSSLTQRAPDLTEVHAAADAPDYLPVEHPPTLAAAAATDASDCMPIEHPPSLAAADAAVPRRHKRIFFVRHGESAWNEAQREYQLSKLIKFDHPLNAQGVQQAQTFAERAAHTVNMYAGADCTAGREFAGMGRELGTGVGVQGYTMGKQSEAAAAEVQGYTMGKQSEAAAAEVQGYTMGKQSEAAAAEVEGYTMGKQSEAAAAAAAANHGADPVDLGVVFATSVSPVGSDGDDLLLNSRAVDGVSLDGSRQLSALQPMGGDDEEGRGTGGGSSSSGSGDSGRGNNSGGGGAGSGDIGSLSLDDGRQPSGFQPIGGSGSSGICNGDIGSLSLDGGRHLSAPQPIRGSGSSGDEGTPVSGMVEIHGGNHTSDDDDYVGWVASYARAQKCVTQSPSTARLTPCSSNPLPIVAPSNSITLDPNPLTLNPKP